MPKAVTIPVKAKCAALYFLHVCQNAKNGSQVGKYEILYQDGKAVSVPLRVGREIGDLNHPTESRQSAVAWEWKAGDGQQALSLLPFEIHGPIERFARSAFQVLAARLCCRWSP